jgi:dTDP-4-dehydrorhamnose reductase
VKILISGAAGLVGSHLTIEVDRVHQVSALTHADLDITDRGAVRRVISELQPDVIFNCAVLQVDDCERDPIKAQAVNIDGPRFLAEAANAAGAEIVHFSTQYAFAGEPLGRTPYTVDDAPNPVNVYGQSKVAGEAAVRSACTRSYIVRTSWVFGSGKASFLCNVHNDLRAGKKVRAIDDIWSSTTYVRDLIDRVMLIVAKHRYGTYHVVNAGICSYIEFAVEAGCLLGLDRSRLDELIEVTHERDMKRAAVRPRYTPLRCILSEQLDFPPMRDWRDALAAYVSESLE